MSREGLYIAAGTYQLASDQLAPYRAADGEKLVRIVSGLTKHGYGVSEPSLRRVPAGYPADHPRGDLLRRTSMMASRNWRPGPWLHTPEALARVRGAWRDAKPLVTWLEEHVGVSTAPGRRGP